MVWVSNIGLVGAASPQQTKGVWRAPNNLRRCWYTTTVLRLYKTAYRWGYRSHTTQPTNMSHVTSQRNKQPTSTPAPAVQTFSRHKMHSNRRHAQQHASSLTTVGWRQQVALLPVPQPSPPLLPTPLQRLSSKPASSQNRRKTVHTAGVACSCHSMSL